MCCAEGHLLIVFIASFKYQIIRVQAVQAMELEVIRKTEVTECIPIQGNTQFCLCSLDHFIGTRSSASANDLYCVI